MSTPTPPNRISPNFTYALGSLWLYCLFCAAYAYHTEIQQIFLQRQNVANAHPKLRIEGVNDCLDKITRILFLYRSLMKGALIFKPTSCANFGISPRSFDRDIQDIRLFLSESFSNMELIFDEEKQGYRIKNLDIKREIGIGETYILVKLLLDSCQLRTDDRMEIVKIMLSQLSATEKRRITPVLRHSPSISPCLSKASVKLIEDLLLSIERKDRISLQFGSQYKEHLCVPFSVEFRSRDSFLAAWDICQEKPRLYILDEIRSYVPANYPYSFSDAEEDALQRLVSAVNCSNTDTCQSFIYKSLFKIF